MALALTVGAPLTDAAESRQSAQECVSDQQNPIEAIPAVDRRELSEDDLDRLGGGAPSDDGSKFFATRGAGGAALIGTSPIGDSSESRDQFRAGFTQSVLERGGELQEEDLPGTDTAIYLRPDGGAAIQGQRGCYAVVIFADRAEVARGQAAAVLGE